MYYMIMMIVIVYFVLKLPDFHIMYSLLLMSIINILILYCLDLLSCNLTNLIYYVCTFNNIIIYLIMYMIM